MTGEARWWIGGLIGLGVVTALVLVVGNLGAPRPEIDPLTVEEVLSGDPPSDRFGDEELHVVGWYASLDGDCEGDDGGSDASVAWLQRDCPLRVLLPAQPDPSVTQDELVGRGLRLAAPQGSAFPSRAGPSGPNLRGQALVFVGHFDDEAAASCIPERLDRCRSTFVVHDYEELVR